MPEPQDGPVTAATRFMPTVIVLETWRTAVKEEVGRARFLPGDDVVAVAISEALEARQREFLNATVKQADALNRALRRSGIWPRSIFVAAILIVALGTLWEAIHVTVAFTVGLLAFVGLALFMLALVFWRVSRNPGPRLRQLALSANTPVRVERDRLKAALHALLEPEMVWLLNQRLKTPPGQVRVLDPYGLSERLESSFEIGTKTLEAARGTLASMRGASVGLAGPRGAGKSALIRALVHGPVTPGEPPPVGISTTAPVRYETVPFVTYLFSRLCVEVLGRDPDEPSKWRRRARPSLLSLAGGASAFIGILVLISATVGLSYQGRQEIIGFCLLVVGFVLLGAAFRDWALVTGDSQVPQAARLAARYLHEMRNLDTTSQGVSATAGPALANLGVERSRSSARQAVMLPELVERYRSLVRAVTEDRQVLVGIDELDKMESEEEARRFLNDIKTLFGEKDCFYLVSVSEDAMSAFERRGMPFRDVFDSSFDTVLRVEPLTCAESAQLLLRRVVGFGACAHALCHALSGGLPRDLIRSARELAEHAAREESLQCPASEIEAPSAGAGETEPADREESIPSPTPEREAAAAAVDTEPRVALTNLLWPIATGRLRAAEHAVRTVAARSVRPDGTQPVLRWLADRPDLSECTDRVLTERWQVATLLAEPPSPPAEEAGEEDMRLVALQFAVLAYHTYALLHVFRGLGDSQLQELDNQLRDGEPQSAVADDSPFELLARARREMTLAPELAWATISKALKSQAEPFPFGDQSAGRAGHGISAAHPRLAEIPPV